MLYSERAKLAKEYEEWVNKPLEDGSKIKDCPLSVITFMMIQGFSKNPEGSVVLTSEQYQNMKEYKNIAEQRKFNLDYANVELKRLEFELKQARKETAKEFAEEMLDFIHNETFRKGYELKKVERKIKEIAKIKGVGVEE